MLPRAPSDGEGLWGGRARRTVGYDLWNLRGMTSTADAARILGNDEAGELADEVKAYRADIDAASEQTGVPYFPPMWDGGGRHWATDVAQLNDPEPWWQVDLEQPTTVARVVVIGYYGDRRYYGFTVETSLDGRGVGLRAIDNS